MSDNNVTPFDLINGSPRSSEDIVEYRLGICRVCPEFRPKTETCRKCGCFMKLKTKIEKARCPLNKW